jgi:hypothetical protein
MADDWVEQMFKNGPEPKGVDDPVFYWPDMKPFPYQESALERIQRRDQTTHVTMMPKRHGKSLAVDYAAMERRVMAQVAEAMRCPSVQSDGADGLLYDRWEKLWDHVASIYLAGWQDHIDEEGCGATMAALKFGP